MRRTLQRTVVFLIGLAGVGSLGAGNLPVGLAAQDVEVLARRISALEKQLPGNATSEGRRALLYQAMSFAHVPLPRVRSTALYPRDNARLATVILLEMPREVRGGFLASIRSLPAPTGTRSKSLAASQDLPRPLPLLASTSAKPSDNALMAPAGPQAPKPATGPVPSSTIKPVSAVPQSAADDIVVVAPKPVVDSAGFREPPVQYAPEAGGPQGVISTEASSAESVGNATFGLLTPLSQPLVTDPFDQFNSNGPFTNTSFILVNGLRLPLLNAADSFPTALPSR